MYPELVKTIGRITLQRLSANRKNSLQPLIDFIQQKVTEGKPVNLNFICTHNARRSHLAQIWAQTAAAHFHISGVYCYSGGTEQTALHVQVAETLKEQGFQVIRLIHADNPVYAVKYAAAAAPVIGFSKKYDHAFNPVSGFAAIMTCSEADGGCPFIAGAEKRISMPYEDPKTADATPQQAVVYAQRSLEIAREMYYVFSKIKPDSCSRNSNS